MAVRDRGDHAGVMVVPTCGRRWRRRQYIPIAAALLVIAGGALITFAAFSTHEGPIDAVSVRLAPHDP